MDEDKTLEELQRAMDNAYDEDNIPSSYDRGDFVIDNRWPDCGMFKIGIVEEIEEESILVVSLPDESLISIPDVSLPYIEVVGDDYYDKMEREKCKNKKKAED